MRRDPLGKVFLVALVLALAAVVGITRAPDAWWVEKLTRAAVIGPWVDRLAEMYRPRDAEEVASDLEGGVEVIYRMDSRNREARPTIIISSTSPLYAEAAESSEALATLSPGSMPELLERRRDWYLVESDGLRGWVFLPEKADRSATDLPPFGSAPAPPRPVPSRAADPLVLAEATARLDGSSASGAPQKLGPYSLHTDVADRGLLIYLSAVAAQLESVYRSRYELDPLPGAKEAVVLFSTRASFVEFLSDNPGLADLEAPGVLRSGVVATYREGRGWSEIAGTLIHELTHSLNKRALGPALPPWLEEGLADDLAQSRIEGLRIFPGSLGGSAERSGSRIDYSGGRAAAIELGRAARASELPRLETLLNLDWDEFQVADRRSRNYGQSSFFVRSLLDSSEPGVASAFREFLRDVSEGGPVTPDALRARLGRTWQALDGQLAGYIERQAAQAGLPAPTRRGSSSRQASEPSS